MGFLSLPPEIIDAILDLSIPYGIEGISLVCKAIHGRARSQIARHNALKRKWGRTNNSVTGRLDDTLGILNDIALDPLVADYIEHLDLWDERSLDQEDGDLLDFRSDDSAMQRVKDFVTSLPFLKEANVDTEEWWTEMLGEEHLRTDPDNTRISCTTVTLLGVLPNLKSIRLDPGWQNFYPGLDESELASSGLMSIVNKASQAPSSSRANPLSQVKAILPFMEPGWAEKAPLQSIQPFLELRSVSEVYLISVVAVDDGVTGYPFEWSSPMLAPQLTRLELAACCMDADGIGELLRHTPSLQTFRYSHETKWHGCEHDWNAGTFVEVVARHCGTTITDLAITIDELQGDIINGVSSLHSFPKLEYLEVDVHIFRGPPVESGQRQGGNTPVPEHERAWNEDDIPCIGSMMPDTIVKVQINTDFPNPDEKALISLLKNLRSQRCERLFQLKECVIRQYTAESARMRVEEAGATLETFDMAVEDPRARKMMPSWKRDFEERIAELRFQK